MDEIIENDYNLNITRYVSTAEAEAEIDLKKTHASILAADEDIRQMTAKHNEFLKELGLALLPGGWATMKKRAGAKLTHTIYLAKVCRKTNKQFHLFTILMDDKFRLNLHIIPNGMICE